ncbi:MAG: acyl-CoA dehydrogenase [Acidimicrobiia bacterium]|nr:acyl-CoA dehydrogenase [Acidimicrobiia bacterium]NNF10644.1 acyl-CoA dehydrogenase [Acidimicrobiia bacterium]NNL71603.1 acyl-CoA dehydrogenase [Acidimicrobiia bacterium]
MDHPHHYRTNLRDIEFNLFEAYRTQEYLGEAPFDQMDEETVRDVLREMDRLAREDFAASFVESDRTPLELNHGEIELPYGVQKSLDAVYEGGWDRLGYAEEIGGFGAPPSLSWAVEELLVGANPAAYFYVSGSMMASVLAEVGTPEQIERFVKPAIERRWGGTMVLTEPDAGSDVGAGVTKAIQVEGDMYHLEGVKRFITSGESTYHENIMHLVLARPEGAGPGTKGLSMFVVPKFIPNEDGSPGERNGVVCTGIEKKMGIKGSATCELTFGMTTPAVGWLVGGVHDGIRQMFRVIEHARMLIGLKSAATLSTGYLNALEYAKVRKQGAHITQASDKTAPRVEIIQHPNVRRMLMEQKAHAEGMRALVYYAGWLQDQERRFPDDDSWARRNDLLLPLIKGYSSEKSYYLLSQALQVFGGSGFTMDYPLEQYIRDAKIDTLYEGTTGIQALDLLFRKIVRDQGETLSSLAAEIMEIVKGGAAGDVFEVERELLGTALEDVQGQINVMISGLMASQASPEEIYKPTLHANALLESLAEVVIGWLLLRHAEVAHLSLEGGEDAFYEGKIASARYFARTVLPKLKLRRELAEIEDASVMAMPVEQF